MSRRLPALLTSATLRRDGAIEGGARDAERRINLGDGMVPVAKRALLVGQGDAWGGDPAGTDEVVRGVIFLPR